MFPVGFDLAMDATRRGARSALPDAPRLPRTAEPREPVRTRLRLAMATRLRVLAGLAARAAERVDPCGGYVAAPPGR